MSHPFRRRRRIAAAASLLGLAAVATIEPLPAHAAGLFIQPNDIVVATFGNLIDKPLDKIDPGTGNRSETGRGAAAGTKLNIPLPPGAGDEVFLEAWQEAERHLEAAAPELILLQCGADSLGGDPITHLRLTAGAHAHAARRVAALADRYAGGRVLAMGGGGYNRTNLASAWTRVVEELAA